MTSGADHPRGLPAGLSPDLRRLLLAAPAQDKSLLELRMTWSTLPTDAHERMAGRLRVFVLNWDPLGWLHEPFAAAATATGDGDTVELVLYVPLPDLLGAEDAAEVLADFGRSVLEISVEQEVLLTSGGYAQLAFDGKAPDLLSATGTLSAMGPPTLTEADAGWEPIGLGAIQDLVQARFGPVALDRSRVALGPAGEPASSCPACAGKRFGFPAELAEAQPAMCPPHAERAAAVVAERIEHARASNPDGWSAIAEASAALSAPTYGLPLALLGRLERAVDRTSGEETPETLREDAAAALEMAARLRERPADFEGWVEHEMAHDWLMELPWGLARRDLVDEAVSVADAFAELDGDNRSIYANDAAVILAEAGRADEALARVHANVDTFTRDVWTHVHAGDVFRTLEDPEPAERAYRRAAALAQAQGDRDDVAAVAERLAELLAEVPGREDAAAEAARTAQRALATGLGGRIAPTTGRNQPCPCGSGRKYKKCCGA